VCFILMIVPKTIMHLLVNQTKDSLQNTLVSTLYREDHLEELLSENEEVAVRRQACMELKEHLQCALDIVNEIRDFNVFI